MAANAVPDRFEVIGSPPTDADTTNTVPIGSPPPGVVHVAIAGGTPAPIPPAP